MNLLVHGSTKVGYTLPVDEAVKMSGTAAGICYMPDDFSTLLSEPEAKTMDRANGAIASVHHSVFGHPTYNLILEGAPKIIAMLLNNEKAYTTSEKSARYTVMSTSPEESCAYKKWMDIFSREISSAYPGMPSNVVKKLARENARYFISVFTPATTMEYTVSLQQANYIIGWCEKLATEGSLDSFIWELRPWLVELSDLLRNTLGVEGGLTDHKGRSFSLFSDKYRIEYFGDTYSTNYEGSFAMLAQVQRHRTLWYEMKVPELDKCSFYVPNIIQSNSALTDEYLADMDSLKDHYPQGMKVKINERGTAEAFMLKCQERLCGAVQLETCLQTKATLDAYIKRTGEPGRWMFDGIHKELKQFEGRSKCQFGYYTCNRPCPLGPSMVYDRLV